MLTLPQENYIVHFTTVLKVIIKQNCILSYVLVWCLN